MLRNKQFISTSDRESTVKFLLEHGADANPKIDGAPIISAAEKGIL